jgi:hypothetical protein
LKVTETKKNAKCARKNDEEIPGRRGRGDDLKENRKTKDVGDQRQTEWVNLDT